jgi:S-formylglutathione hydrolase FrmB
MLEDGNLQRLLERGFSEGVSKEFVFVVADYSTKTLGSFYENSPVSGRWLDFTVKELVPFIDSHFRTNTDRKSRAVVGDYMGGRGALQFAMKHADVFSIAYALHPVATGTGYSPWSNLNVDWKKIYQAKSLADLDGGLVFIVGLHQAFLPNVNRPPFYCDFFMEPVDGEPTSNTENTIRAQRNFLLDRSLEQSLSNLKSMRAIAFDWARYDGNQDHVYSVRAFTNKLDDLGIEHEAEEYRGTPGSKNWTDDGRFYTRVLPFLNRWLE